MLSFYHGLLSFSFPSRCLSSSTDVCLSLALQSHPNISHLRAEPLTNTQVSLLVHFIYLHQNKRTGRHKSRASERRTPGESKKNNREVSYRISLTHLLVTLYQVYLHHSWYPEPTSGTQEGTRLKGPPVCRGILQLKCLRDASSETIEAFLQYLPRVLTSPVISSTLLYHTSLHALLLKSYRFCIFSCYFRIHLRTPFAFPLSWCDRRNIHTNKFLS